MPIDNSFPDCPNINTLEKKKFKEDSNGDVCVNVCIADDNTEQNQNSFHTGMVSVATIPGTEVTVLTFVVGVGVDRFLTQGYASTGAPGCVRLKVNGTLEHTARLNPSDRNIYLKFDPSFPIVAGDVVSLTFESISGIAATTVEGFISGIDY